MAIRADIAGQRYRLIGFDTPETRFADCADERAMGNRATRRASELVATARELTLHVHEGRDRYGRGLAELKVDGRDLGRVLIEEGLARAYHGGKRAVWCN
jgi:micrococcal nuclease